MLRTCVYVDGYNFYYGCLKGGTFKWLDLLQLFQKNILPSVRVSKDNQNARFELVNPGVKFLTAPILEQAASASDSLQCQEIYHAALSQLYQKQIQIVKGYYSLTKARARKIDCNNPKKWPKYCVPVDIWKLEEKQSDVNLALHAFKDAVLGEVDQVVIVTNDTDIVPAVKMIREFTQVSIGLVIPTTNSHRRPNQDLVQYAHWVRTHLAQQELKSAQLPRTVTNGRKTYSKPDSWFAYPHHLQEILRLGVSHLGNRSKVFQWLNKSNPYWNDKRPIDMLETGEGEQIIEFMRIWESSASG